MQDQVWLADKEGNLTKGHGRLAGGHRVPSPCMHLTSKRSGGDWRGMSHVSIKCSRGAGRWGDGGLLQGEGAAVQALTAERGLRLQPSPRLLRKVTLLGCEGGSGPPQSHVKESIGGN